MTAGSFVQLPLYFAIVLLCVKPLGWYMAQVYTGASIRFVRILQPLERGIYRLCSMDSQQEMTWREYARAVLILGLLSCVSVYAVQRLQQWLPFNTESLPNVAPDSSWNTAVSFSTNTNWQSYSGETTMSYFTQTIALTVQNFVSAATGMAVLAALIRGLTRQSSGTIGNYWVDLVRGILYVLLPLSLVLAVLLVSQGVVQSWGSYPVVATLEQHRENGAAAVPTQRLAIGPVASQVAIKQLGTNGGGFFGTNSSHPFENPTPLSNFLEMLAILLIPASLCYTFGAMVRDKRQGWALLAAMTLVVIPITLVVIIAEQHGNPILTTIGVDATASEQQAGGNMEGKETRFGIVNSSIWAVATTAASNGSVNCMHDSLIPISGLLVMWLIQLGEVIFGGVGSGLYGLLLFVFVAVFIAGLMVGRTPEYLGKKIGAFEMKMAALGILLPCVTVLVGTAIAVSSAAGTGSIHNPGAHGFSEVLYAFSSAGNNNGSAFAGLNANTTFYNGLLGLAMLIGRYWVIVPVLAIAGSLAAKKHVAIGPGSLPTHTPLFVMLLVAVIVTVGALSFFPALALGPIVEQVALFTH